MDLVRKKKRKKKALYPKPNATGFAHKPDVYLLDPNRRKYYGKTENINKT